MYITYVSYSTQSLPKVHVLNKYHHQNSLVSSYTSRGLIPKKSIFLLCTREWEHGGNLGLETVINSNQGRDIQLEFFKKLVMEIYWVNYFGGYLLEEKIQALGNNSHKWPWEGIRSNWHIYLYEDIFTKVGLLTEYRIVSRENNSYVWLD